MVQSADWLQVRELFEAALTVDMSVRREWLLARAQPRVAEEVLSLLAADSAPLVPLDDPAAFLHLSLTDEPEQAAVSAGVGERLGPFEILGVLGSGRSGVVYRAWQAFPPRRWRSR